MIEGAHFSDTGTAKMARRHRLHSEASYRFERGTDRELPPRATARAAALLASLGGATDRARRHARAGAGHAGDDRAGGRLPGPGGGRRLRPGHRRRPAAGGRLRGALHPGERACRRSRPWRAGGRGGRASQAADARARAGTTGQHTVLLVTPPSWRPDLTDPADLAEEVIRLEGYSNVPVRQPRATAGHGLTERQQALRAIARTLGRRRVRRGARRAVRPGQRGRQPACSAPEDPRRPAVAVANPLSEDQPLLRTTLLPGLFRALARNVGRGFGDIALFETGLVFLPPRRARRASRRSSPPTGARPRRSSRRSTRRCPTSRCGSPGCWRGQPRAARLVGPGRRRDLGRRDRGGPLGRRRGAT